MIVDEAGTADTPKLAQLAQLADQHHWRVVLVGDPRQFAAVGRGGMFAHLVDKFGAVELDQVHRFQHQWERQASLRLRTGDPGVLTEYQRYGRIHDGPLETMEAHALGGHVIDEDKPMISAILGGPFLSSLIRHGIHEEQIQDSASRLIVAWLKSAN